MARVRIALIVIAAAILGTTMVLQRGREPGAELPAQVGPTTVALVNEAALQVIDNLDRTAPTIVARDLYLLHGAIYEAWSAFDDAANGQVVSIYDDTLADRFPGTPLGRVVLASAHQALLDITAGTSPATMAPFDELLDRLGVDPVPLGTDTAEGVSALIANRWLETRGDDGANQSGRFRDPRPSPPSDDTSRPPSADTILSWQPEIVATGSAVDNDGRPVVDLADPDSYRTTTFSTPHWGEVVPFALASGDEHRPALDPPDVASLTGELEQLVELTSSLDQDAIAAADYWAVGEQDGFAPGRWNSLTRTIALRDLHRESDDIKLFFALNAALLDASIAATDAQVFADLGRPVGLVPALLDDEVWRPLRPADLGSPASPGYVADDSVYAAAAAQVLEQLKRSNTFAAEADGAVIGDVGRVVMRPEASRLGLLTTEIELHWPTFADAADQAGMAQQWSGVATSSADEDGRVLGRLVATAAVARAASLWLGIIEPSPA